MKWNKRLKWLRISKVVIPIALAVSLVFAGFSVYGSEAQNFVIRTDGEKDVKLSLTMDYDLSNLTSLLQIPFTGGQTNSTFSYENGDIGLYDAGNKKSSNINAIAQRTDIKDVVVGEAEKQGNKLPIFTAFSFFLYNGSERSVDYTMIMNLDEVVKSVNGYNHHVDDVLRIMLIEDEPLISDGTFTVYSKEEVEHSHLIKAEDIPANNPYLKPVDETKTKEDCEKVLLDNTDYSSAGLDGFVTYFESEEIIFTREYQNFEAGAAKKYTIVMWLEGWDEQCTDQIYGEKMRMSIDFIGY